MIVCPGLVFSVGSPSANSFRPAGRGVVLSFPPTSANLNAAPGTMPNSSIAYLTSTMHDG
jgi:hypothetical protein